MTCIADYIGKSAVENVKNALAAARRNDSHNALLALTEERALKQAELVDAGKISGRLAGVPFVVKDNFLAFGAPTTAASEILKEFYTPIQATAIERLEAEGAVCIGKANLDAFAHGGSTENSAFEPTKNAIDTSRVSGGSSGGSAVVTALGIVPFALGSDTGGSIRQPASFNGVFGMKPTYGMVSRYGVVAMASSTDVVGCFTTNVEDIELVLSIMSGKDAHDMTTLASYFIPTQLKKPLKIGLIKECITNDLDQEVKQATYDYVDELRGHGHIVEEVSLPMLKHALAMYYIIVPAEITSNLARYDGVRYGRRAKDVADLADLYGKSRNEGFVTENKRRIMIGSYVLSSGFFDAYYLQAQKARTVLIQQFDDIFESFDILLTPTAPTPAFKLGENTADPIKMYLSDIMTVPASLAGLPAISVPAAMTTGGLPIGVQLIGPQKSDATILALAKQNKGMK